MENRLLAVKPRTRGEPGYLPSVQGRLDNQEYKAHYYRLRNGGCMTYAIDPDEQRVPIETSVAATAADVNPADVVSSGEVGDYIADMLSELQQLAALSGRRPLEALLALAEQEARRSAEPAARRVTTK
jgi:hypothetical protein